MARTRKIGIPITLLAQRMGVKYSLLYEAIHKGGTLSDDERGNLALAVTSLGNETLSKWGYTLNFVKL